MMEETPETPEATPEEQPAKEPAKKKSAKGVLDSKEAQEAYLSGFRSGFDAHDPKPSPAPKACPRCYLPEAEVGDCVTGSFPGHLCPDPVEAHPDTHVTVRCGPCDFTRIVPIGDLIKGKAKGELPHCGRDECAARLVR